MSSNEPKKLSLLSAISINLNVLIGTGLFINTYKIATSTGAAGFFLYPALGLCMLPLITVFGKLLEQFPTGGLYTFGKSYNPFLGFLSCWSYFFGKLASASVMLTVATTMFKQLVPGLQNYNTVTITLFILCCFTLLNLANMKIGVIVQSFFLSCKSIPILFIILAGIFYFDTTAITPENFIWSGMMPNIPFALYCLAGFETACALGRNIENPTVNGPKAVYYSFGIVLLIYGIFQGFTYLLSHTALTSISGYEGIFPAITHMIFNSDVFAQKFAILLSFAIGSSALGGAYSILFSNSWNLYTLAENDHIFGSNFIKQLNRNHTPWIAVITETAICTFFLLLSQGSIIPLQRTATLGIIIAYAASCFAYYHLVKKESKEHHDFIIAWTAFLTCLLFIASCANSFIQTGITPLLLFIFILALGSAMFFMQKNKLFTLKN
ncbi:MAG: APC family permease [Candidatus Chromulinivorax sp.]